MAPSGVATDCLFLFADFNEPFTAGKPEGPKAQGALGFSPRRLQQSLAGRCRADRPAGPAVIAAGPICIYQLSPRTRFHAHAGPARPPAKCAPRPRGRPGSHLRYPRSRRHVPPKARDAAGAGPRSGRSRSRRARPSGPRGLAPPLRRRGRGEARSRAGTQEGLNKWSLRPVPFTSARHPPTPPSRHDPATKAIVNR